MAGDLGRHLPLARLVRRLAALSYEALLLMAVVFIASFVLTPLVSPGSAASGALMMPTVVARTASLIALIALGAAFFGWSWSNGRRTLPMKTWRLRLVTADGAALSPRRALARYAATWIGPALAIATYALFAPRGLEALAWPVAALNWLAAFVDPQRQFLHDRIAGTRLVNSPA